MLHMCRSPWFSSSSLSTSTCPSPSSSTPLSWCTLTCTQTLKTWTPWKITCATPPRGGLDAYDVDFSLTKPIVTHVFWGMLEYLHKLLSSLGWTECVSTCRALWVVCLKRCSEGLRSQHSWSRSEESKNYLSCSLCLRGRTSCLESGRPLHQLILHSSAVSLSKFWMLTRVGWIFHM